jgi:hypothetical protein
MKVYLKYVAMFGVMTVVACSPVKFAQGPSTGAECNGLGASACTVNTSGGTTTYEVSQQVGKGVADILVVDDNSGSMSFEQRAMASHFSGFISSLRDIDYRIAITTTDVSGVSPAPGVGTSPYASARDGKLLSFASGSFLTPAVGSSQAESQFASTIQRQETIDCENGGFKSASCPSNDERAIYAANLVAANNPGGFIRATGALTVIILSDEDARSGNYRAGGQGSALFPLASMDQPSTLIDKIKAMYPNKTLKVHSIVVRDGDESCLNYQKSEIPGNSNITSSYGLSYSSLSSATGGTIGSICGNNNDLNYTAQLGQISGTIVDQVNTIALSCAPVTAPEVYICSSVAAGNKCQTSANSSDYSYDSSKNAVNLNGSLGSGTTVRVVYTCKN